MAFSLSRTHAAAVWVDDGQEIHEAALTAPGPWRRAVVVVGDLLGAVGIVLCIPFVILAIGIPIALCVRVLSWVGGLVL